MLERVEIVLRDVERCRELYLQFKCIIGMQNVGK